MVKDAPAIHFLKRFRRQRGCLSRPWEEYQQEVPRRRDGREASSRLRPRRETYRDENKIYDKKEKKYSNTSDIKFPLMQLLWESSLFLGR